MAGACLRSGCWQAFAASVHVPNMSCRGNGTHTIYVWLFTWYRAGISVLVLVMVSSWSAQA